MRPAQVETKRKKSGRKGELNQSSYRSGRFDDDDVRRREEEELEDLCKNRRN